MKVCLLFVVISLFAKKSLARLPAKDLRSLVTQLYLYLQLQIYKIRLKEQILSSLCLHIIRLERLVVGTLFGAHLLLNLSMTEEPSLARLSHGMVRRPPFQTTWMAMENQTLLGLDAG
ncbi:hypothetical protein X922_27560 [Pseudomonas aeruginosa VRFPA08]|nr:hypothetical protein X922_27560 [Pseudomonas aeruginosa VRFPA08]